MRFMLWPALIMWIFTVIALQACSWYSPRLPPPPISESPPAAKPEPTAAAPAVRAFNVAAYAAAGVGIVALIGAFALRSTMLFKVAGGAGLGVAAAIAGAAVSPWVAIIAPWLAGGLLILGLFYELYRHRSALTHSVDLVRRMKDGAPFLWDTEVADIANAAQQTKDGAKTALGALIATVRRPRGDDEVQAEREALRNRRAANETITVPAPVPTMQSQ